MFGYCADRESAIIETESNNQPYDVAVSLGDLCQVAWQLSHHNLRGAAFPFDWLITPFESLYSFLMIEGANFIARENLVVVYGEIPHIEDSFYRIKFLHDFSMSPVVLENYDDIKKKYDRRIKRFFELLHSNKKVLFIRRGITYEQACRLENFFNTYYPNLNYTILAVGSTEEMNHDWKLEKVRNFYLGEFGWQGHPDAWIKILNHFPIRSPSGEEKALD
jgi:hypothetical protein